MKKLEDLITAYRTRFKDDPPLMWVEKKDLGRRIRAALKTGQPIDLKSMGVPDEADVSPSTEKWTWQEGLYDPTIDTTHKHNWLELHYVPDPENPDTSFTVAYISPPQDEVFTVQLLLKNLPDTVDPGPIAYRIRQELDYFLSDLRERDPEKYLRYYCTTAANIYSRFQWAYMIFEPVKPSAG